MFLMSTCWFTCIADRIHTNASRWDYIGIGNVGLLLLQAYSNGGHIAVCGIQTLATCIC